VTLVIVVYGRGVGDLQFWLAIFWFSPRTTIARMTTNTDITSGKHKIDTTRWKAIVAKYQRPCIGRSSWQLINTLVPYAAIWVAMYFCLMVAWWLVIPLVVLAAGFLVRTFIISHDCGHGSFFKSRRANDIWGFITGVLTFTPYYQWRWEHSIHHATSGDLDARGTGDVWTLTVQEYLEASRWKKFAYRLARNPFILFVLAPLFVFLIKQRFPTAGAGKREKLSVYWTNAAILGLAVVMCLILGWKAYLLIHLAVLMIAGSVGIWLFYVQHQFEGVYWERQQDWDYTTAALKGSSFYKLPKLLQWFSGNIGFHHLHHLSPRIPNYNLEKCHDADPLFQSVKQITLLSSFKSFSYRLWDEKRRQLVGYSHLRKLRRQEKQARAFRDKNLSATMPN
jgi:omega-6 fatty acid desaturase (delta-12 desaturase)